MSQQKEEKKEAKKEEKTIDTKIKVIASDFKDQQKKTLFLNLVKYAFQLTV
jgi:hypothetical protein